ncbi:unnamed protein product [Ambrosiozyma monospora]|uniref:Unnamed protein product n=1 Tax=Ambrosiozyma monospora TaxID=43982 RepID=A0ACB5U4Q4_AMBMO|nr:unnamed protein product [Ambrosiozyma monospora]
MAIQGEKGIEIKNRKWHLRTHNNCFVSMDLVNWLIENFQDIDTREEAVEYGNHLMDKGLIFHVESKHRFLDGHYFYAFSKNYQLEHLKSIRAPMSEDVDSSNVTPGSTNDKFNLRSPITPTAPPLSPKKTNSEDTSRTPSLRLLSGLTSPTAPSAHFSDADVSSTQEIASKSVKSFHGKRKVVLN